MHQRVIDSQEDEQSSCKSSGLEFKGLDLFKSSSNFGGTQREKEGKKEHWQPRGDAVEGGEKYPRVVLERQRQEASEKERRRGGAEGESEEYPQSSCSPESLETGGLLRRGAEIAQRGREAQKIQ